jgi:hypothetical protein
MPIGSKNSKEDPAQPNREYVVEDGAMHFANKFHDQPTSGDNEDPDDFLKDFETAPNVNASAAAPSTVEAERKKPIVVRDALDMRKDDKNTAELRVAAGLPEASVNSLASAQLSPIASPLGSRRPSNAGRAASPSHMQSAVSARYVRSRLVQADAAQPPQVQSVKDDKKIPQSLGKKQMYIQQDGQKPSAAKQNMVGTNQGKQVQKPAEPFSFGRFFANLCSGSPKVAEPESKPKLKK